MPEQTPLSPQVRSAILRMQKNECTECLIYEQIARRLPQGPNRETLLRIAQEERAHGALWEQLTGQKVQPNRRRVWWYTTLARLFGFTFAAKLMENGEDAAVGIYEQIGAQVPQAQQIALDEQQHEQQLLEMLDEERLRYVGSMVLGLNDALVELTGTLAGLTFAMQSNRLVALSGLITGISATFSMASSEYLSARSEGREDALKSSVYTGVMYLFAVAMLVLPYLVLPDGAFVAALGAMLAVVVLIILGFTFYISVAKGLPFKKRFLEMVTISLTVAAASFAIGLLVKEFLGIDIG